MMFLIGSICFLFCFLGYQAVDPPSLITNYPIAIDRKALKKKLISYSTEELQEMRDAGEAIEKWNTLLVKTRSHVVDKILKGEDFFFEGKKYPYKGIFDLESSAHYYYHAHRPYEHGHFHLFLYEKGIPDGLFPLLSNRENRTEEAFVHLIAISMTEKGVPIKLFTTNRWVTGEDWYSASAVKEMVKRFHVDHTYPSYVVNQWVNAMVVLFYPQITELIDKRYALVKNLSTKKSLVEVLEDLDLDVTSEETISIEVQLEVIREILEERGGGFRGVFKIIPSTIGEFSLFLVRIF